MCGTQRAIKTYQIVSALQKFTMQGKAWLFNYVSNGSGLLADLIRVSQHLRGLQFS